MHREVHRELRSSNQLALFFPGIRATGYVNELRLKASELCGKLKFDCHFRFIRTGDLTSNVSDNGIGELHSKRVARQIAAALEFVHQKYGRNHY